MKWDSKSIQRAGSSREGLLKEHTVGLLLLAACDVPKQQRGIRARYRSYSTIGRLQCGKRDLDVEYVGPVGLLGPTWSLWR